MVETTKGMSWSGSEKGLDEGMLYLSNHRDIVLDPSLVNVVLLNREEVPQKLALAPISCPLLGSSNLFV